MILENVLATGSGSLVGFVLGLIGGGFLIVPGIVAATDMPLISAIGSSLVSVTALGLTIGAGRLDTRSVLHRGRHRRWVCRTRRSRKAGREQTSTLENLRTHRSRRWHLRHLARRDRLTNGLRSPAIPEAN